ncbi:sensor histidine kinase [Streptomyces triculaminicus]|uniref:sensor histidine kinase n=1 Tax=Streptomyces triculaminicus TaxID=2816232 RepID=UPI0033C8E25F
MSVGGAKAGAEKGSRRLSRALAAVPRALREDLFTLARDPLPRQASLGRLPHAHVVLFAVVVGVAQLGEYEQAIDLAPVFVELLIAVQASAVVLVMSRPVAAWWLSTGALFLIAYAGDARVGRDMLWPWSISGVALQTMLLFLLALRVRTRVAAEALAITVLAGVANMELAEYDHNQVLTRAVGYLVGAVVVGVSLRTGRVARTRLVEQEVLTTEERARRTLLEERNRIARELHDVVAHHMSVISIQAQVAPHLVRDPSDELRENLAGIRQNALEALTELRQVLGVLRSEDAAADAARHAPQPGLDRLDELVDNVRGAGVTVEVRRSGEVRPLSPGVELSAFRIAQEALSNAMRHAPGASVRVDVGYGPAALTLRVANTAPARPARPSPGAGHGLLGMRERAAMLGGDLVTGPAPGGGYEVMAELPTPTAEDAHA